MGKTDVAVFVGRFQPVHRAHLRIMEEALKKEADRLIVVVGSHRSPRTLRNPWTFEERKSMIELSLPLEMDGRVEIVPLRDFLYSDTHWAVGLQNAVRPFTKGKTVKLIGHFKDDSSHYLDWFPQWDLVRTEGTPGVNSRDIRESYFDNTHKAGWELIHQDKLSPPATEFMFEFSRTDRYKELCKEATFLRGYRKMWESSPFPPVFVTTDMVVIKGGHVLLVRRKMNPGKGLLALPGGFVKNDKSILDSALEELKEETNIVYPRQNIVQSIRSTRVFDHPERDRRGRTITHAFCVNLPSEGPLPEVEGGDDAAEALWMPLADLSLNEDKFFSDHFHIIEFFVHQEVSK